MKNLLIAAQAQVADQVGESGLTLDRLALKRVLMAGVAAAAVLSALPSQAQVYAPYNGPAPYGQSQDTPYGMNEREARSLSDAAGQAARTIGYDAQRGNPMGGQVANALGVGVSTLMKMATGQRVSGQETAGTIGQVVGGVAGYKLSGDSRTSKVVGTVVGAAAGGVAGSIVGRGIDESNHQSRIDTINGGTPAVQTTAADREAFVESMRAAAQRPIANVRPVSNAQYGYAPPVQPQGQRIRAEQAGFTGLLATMIDRGRLPLAASGGAEMSDNAMAAVAGKGVELVKVGQAYAMSVQRWDEAFMNSQSPQEKQRLNVEIAGRSQLLQAKVFEYVQVRNAAVAQGYNVQLMDGAVAGQLPNLKEQTNYQFLTTQRTPQPRW